MHNAFGRDDETSAKFPILNRHRYGQSKSCVLFFACGEIRPAQCKLHQVRGFLRRRYRTAVRSAKQKGR